MNGKAGDFSGFFAPRASAFADTSRLFGGAPRCGLEKGLKYSRICGILHLRKVAKVLCLGGLQNRHSGEAGTDANFRVSLKGMAKKMQYCESKIKKHHFIVTPEELRAILKDFHHVVVNTGVRKDYIESDPNNFFMKYDALYRKLRNGDRLVWENDYDISWFTTGITRHLQNCQYKPSSKLSVPHFVEPCPWIDTFCMIPWKDQLSTSFSVTQFPAYVCGLCLYYPAQVWYETANEKHTVGIVANTALDDYETYETLISRIKAMTKPLKLVYNGKAHRTAVSISVDAKKDFENFYFVTSNNIGIL